LAEAASKEISCIDRGMTVVGKMPARNKDVAALDPLIRFGGTAEGRKVVTAFHRADPQVRRLLAQHVEAMVRFSLAGRAPALQDALAAQREPPMRQSRRPAPDHSETRHCHPQPHNGEVAGLGSVDATLRHRGS
jgi:hypothetical protein